MTVRPKIKLPAEFPFSTEMAVRVSDVNYAGHLSNDRVLSFLHEARARYFKQHGFTELNVEGYGTIMTDAVLIYKSEAFHGDLLRIEIAAGAFHRYGCHFYYRVTNRDSGREVARAQTGMVFYDYQQNKMVPMPPRFLELFGTT